MNRFYGTTTFRTSLVCVPLLVMACAAWADTNIIFDSAVTVNSNMFVKGLLTVSNNVNVVSNLTARSITLNSQTLSNWPGLGTVLTAGADAGNQPLTNISYISVNDESTFNGRVNFYSRVNVVGGASGVGALMISPDESDINSESADFAVAHDTTDYFADAQPGDTCIRALTGAIRIGYVSEFGGNSSVIIDANGKVTLARGALILTPQGDLSMGSFTNSP